MTIPSEKNEKKVLLIEDDELLIGILSEQFRQSGFTVIIAVDGEQGLQKFFAEKPDVVILDIVMPKVDGIRVLKAIHERAPKDKTPIIVLTNSTEMEHIASAVDHHVAAYLIKSEQHLLEVVETAKKHVGIS